MMLRIIYKNKIKNIFKKVRFWSDRADFFAPDFFKPNPTPLKIGGGGRAYFKTYFYFFFFQKKFLK
jgi:hypothetical protein